MGSIDSEMGEAMLNAAEEILRQHGYAALTSRKIAEHLGVKQRLVYYYFRSMDELLRESFTRLSIRELARLKSAVSSDRPLHEIWDVCIDTSDARLISEFMALANRNEGVKAEVVTFILESRKLQVAALKKVMMRYASHENFLPAEVLAFMGTSLALALNREASLGIRKCHAPVKKMIASFFEAMEPEEG